MYNYKKELAESEIENKIFEDKNEIYKNSMAEKLINKGLGTEIKRVLNNPVKVTKFKILINKFNNLFKSIIDVL